MQSNFSGAKKIITLLNSINKQNISFIGIAWEEFVEDIVTNFEEQPAKINIVASEIDTTLLARIARNLTIAEKETIKKYAEDNLFILSLVVKYINQYTDKPISEIIKSIPKSTTNELVDKLPNQKAKLERLLFCISVFGQYDIDITIEFLEKHTDSNQDFINNLIQKKIIRKRGKGITLGHKSYNRLIFEYLQQSNIKNWYKTKKQLDSNSDFILELLKSLQPNQIYSILKKLYENTAELASSSFIIDVWQSMDNILDKILILQKTDSRWNNEASSTLFAIQILNNFGFTKEAKKSIDFFRSFYTLDKIKNNIDIDFSALRTTKDFETIKNCMKFQDDNEVLNGEKGKDIKEEVFHKNWLSGVILSAEGIHNSLPKDDLLKLAECVEGMAINETYFYPERVSWCSSRVLIGLGLCNRNVENSRIVANVADWLLNHPNYDNENGYWKSGTGTWNHWFEATALAISALIGVGISPEHPKIKKGVENLIANKNLFVQRDRELDGIFALQTLSQANVDLFDVQEEIKILSEWMMTKADWASIEKTADITFKQSCQVSQSAAGLIEILWKIVRTDLPTIVKAIDKKSVETENVTIFVSYEWESQKFAKNLVKKLQSKYGRDNVFFDLKDNNNLSATQFMEKINEVDFTLYLCTQKYKEKADKRVGGVGYEADQISKNIFDRQDKFIPILLEGKWKAENMPNFWTSTIGVSCLDKKLTEKVMTEIYKKIEVKFINNNKNGQ